MCSFFCVRVVPCSGSGLATGQSLVQGVLPSVNDQEKLRNQPYAPKWEQAPECGSKRKEKKTCFGQLGHHQELKTCLMKKSLVSLVADAYTVPLMRVCCGWCVMLLSVVFFFARLVLAF
jgi:hypothetical protein